MAVARIIVDLSLDKIFDYLIPNNMLTDIEPGVQVQVPFRHSFRRGYILEIVEKSKFDKLKSIDSILHSQPRISARLLSLGEWLADYYCCSREQAVRTLLPGAVRSGKIKDKLVSHFSISNIEGAKRYIAANIGNKRSESIVKTVKFLITKPNQTANDIIALVGIKKSSITSLKKKDFIDEEKVIHRKNLFKDSEILPSKPLIPNSEQKVALEIINNLTANENREKHTVLLHGVTGSGKTEVYLQAISKVLNKGKESIVLVPEISLTPQTVQRFRARFGNEVSVLHSALTSKERFDEWKRVYEGSVKIVVGARSALFAPFNNLGLIIVDEEHENSYKQSESPRYHARDVAVMRGLKEKAVVILGSATPSIESYHNAKIGKYILIQLLNRVEDGQMPISKIVDMRREKFGEGKISFFSKELKQAIRKRIVDGEQTILFLNRRGFARRMVCQQCGFVAGCPDCSITYTYHRSRQLLICHMCGTEIPAYHSCPECKTEDIRYSGLGTEKVEDITAALFPGAKIARMDSDTMTRISKYEEVLQDFMRGNIDILIGTQMISKGLHFPNVTLVGVLNADLSLFIPDFRAEERTFQLLTQVSGRAGREEIRGEVIVQTYSPFNPAIQFAVNNDYEGFYEEEIEIRNEFNYPPGNGSHMIIVHFRGEDEDIISNYSIKFLDWLKPVIHNEIIASEPCPSPISKVKAKYRYQIILRGNKLKQLRKMIRSLIFHQRHPKGVEVYVDVDALSSL